MVRLAGTRVEQSGEGDVGSVDVFLTVMGHTMPPKPLYCTSDHAQCVRGARPASGPTHSFKDEAMPRRPLVPQPQFAPKNEPPLKVRGGFVPPKQRRPRKQQRRKLAPLQAACLRAASPSKRTVSPTERALEREQERNDRMWADARAQQRHALRAQRRAYYRDRTATRSEEAIPSAPPPNH